MAIPRLRILLRKENFKKKLVDILAILVLILICALGIRLKFLQHGKFQTNIHVLTSVHIDNVRMFTLFPKGDGLPIYFEASDDLVKDFFSSLQDIQSYSPSHDRVVSWEFCWILEMVINEIKMRIPFYIPSHNREIVVGEIADFTNGGRVHYGHFQSRQLYQWYQTYSHRWLTPEGTPPAPQP